MATFAPKVALVDTSSRMLARNTCLGSWHMQPFLSRSAFSWIIKEDVAEMAVTMFVLKSVSERSMPVAPQLNLVFFDREFRKAWPPTVAVDLVRGRKAWFAGMPALLDYAILLTSKSRDYLKCHLVPVHSDTPCSMAAKFERFGGYSVVL
nr:hypothetical protein [Paraburkholderia sp. LEh10]